VLARVKSTTANRRRGLTRSQTSPSPSRTGDPAGKSRRNLAPPRPIPLPAGSGEVAVWGNCVPSTPNRMLQCWSSRMTKSVTTSVWNPWRRTRFERKAVLGFALWWQHLCKPCTRDLGGQRWPTGPRKWPSSCSSKGEFLTGSGWRRCRDRKLRRAPVECRYVGTFSRYQWDIVSAPSITDQITMTKTTIRQRQRQQRDRCLLWNKHACSKDFIEARKGVTKCVLKCFWIPWRKYRQW